MAKQVLQSNRAERTVMTYAKIEFRGDWEYHGHDYSFRPVGDKAELLVVTESPSGVRETHWFSVRRRPDPFPGGSFATDGVIVPKEHNIVYIPERCVQRKEGDHTECARR